MIPEFYCPVCGRKKKRNAYKTCSDHNCKRAMMLKTLKKKRSSRKNDKKH